MVFDDLPLQSHERGCSSAVLFAPDLRTVTDVDQLDLDSNLISS
jgi:hypothetical protein